MRSNELKEWAFETGRNGFKDGLNGAPNSAVDFMKFIHSEFGGWEDKMFKMRCKLMKEYIRGWTYENLSQEL